MTEDMQTTETGDAQEESVLSRVNKTISRQFESEDELVQWADNANKAIGANEHSKLAQEAKDFQEKTGKLPSEFLVDQSQANAESTIAQATDTGTGQPADVTTNVADMPMEDLEKNFEEVISSL
jgi:hypothetical protein